jgi:hypothetical protein
MTWPLRRARGRQTAKKRFTAQGGRLRDGYTIAEFGAGLTFRGVDDIGRVHWQGAGEPTVTEVAARR